MNKLAFGMAFVMAAVGMAGCLDSDPATDSAAVDLPPFLDYAPVEPDMALELVQESFRLAGSIPEVELYVRVVRPAGDGPFPVISQFTPYTAPGTNAAVANFMEPLVPCTGMPLVGSVGCGGAFDYNFVRRGYAFAYADVRGTGDSTGCLDLRGQGDIDDLWNLTEWLGTQEWSTGKVGFIGASYPGSEAHMAALANNEHLAAVVPIVASTSFYHYHHNDGVPYNGQHSLGGTNTGYTSEGVTPTANPQSSGDKLANQADCPHVKHAVDYGGMDQTGTYDEWWVERNLRSRAANVTVPVLMAQGLADWNVKPDHIATWFNDVPADGATKTLIAGQWGHQYPANADEAYGPWWTYVSAFFDTFVKGVETGMFEQNVAWVQDNAGKWHRSSSWPLIDAPALALSLHPGGKLGGDAHPDNATESWNACSAAPLDGGYGRTNTRTGVRLGAADVANGICSSTMDQELVYESEPVDSDMLISGVPTVTLLVQSEQELNHLVAVLEVVGENGNAVRQNYGYLNPVFRNGLDNPEAVVPGEPYLVTIDFYPQEDLIQEGDSIRLTLRSHDNGRTIESFENGSQTIVWTPAGDNVLNLPLRPAALTGVRL